MSRPLIVLFVFLILISLLLVLPRKKGEDNSKTHPLNYLKELISKQKGNQSPAPIVSPQPSQSPESTPAAGFKKDQYGVTLGLAGNEAYVGQALEKVAGIGVGWARVQCDWRNIEPSDNNWDWSICDSFVNQVNKNGQKPLTLLWLDSKWCRMAAKDDPKAKSKPQCTDEQFNDYITQVVTRYKGKVTHYEIGNEPDLMPEWRDDPAQYAKTLHLAYQAIKKADPNAKVLNGGLAACSGQNCSKTFAPAIIGDSQYPALENLDIVNYHTYAKKSDMAALYKTIRSRVGNKPIWVTEVGFPSEKAYQDARRPGYGYPAGEEGQAAYLKDVLPYLLGLGVEKVFWYSLIDVPKDKGEFCSYGLMYLPGKQCLGTAASGTDVTEKKSFAAYKELIQ